MVYLMSTTRPLTKMFAFLYTIRQKHTLSKHESNYPISFSFLNKAKDDETYNVDNPTDL